VVKILVTKDERAVLQAGADKAHVSLSTWLRLVGLQASG